MAADKSDEPGVLGNLPRSRPGQRSAKRGGSSATPSTRARVAKAKTRAKAKSSPRTTRAKRPAPARTTATAASERPPAERSQPQSSPPQQSGDDPLTGAVKVAAKVATIGPRAAVGMAKRLLGR